MLKQLLLEGMERKLSMMTKIMTIMSVGGQRSRSKWRRIATLSQVTEKRQSECSKVTGCAVEFGCRSF